MQFIVYIQIAWNYFLLTESIFAIFCAKYLYRFQWIPPPQENQKEKEADEQIAIDLGDEYEQALTSASQEEIIDLAGKNHLKLFFRLEFTVFNLFD